MKRILTLLLASISLTINAQERCGTEAHTKSMINNNPEYAIARNKVNDETKKWLAKNPNYSSKSIITIPVVVHVVWKNSGQNISDAQILSQIDLLNKDFRRLNIDTINTPSIW